MRRNPLSRLAALAAAAVLALTACSGGDGATSLGPVPTVPPTVTSTSTTAPPATSTTSTTATSPTTAARASTTTTTARPVIVDGIPQVTATPSRAAVGARVRIEGTGFTEEMWKQRDTRLWLRGSSGCGLLADAEHTITVSASGRLTGELVVPATGNCPQSSVGDVPITTGTYRIVFMCTPCAIGQLEVTSNAVQCANVGFAPNTDNVAGDIVAVGLGCAEAEALVRKVGAQVGSIGPPARVEADGFECVRTSQYEGMGLPSATFTCTSGAKKVTFVRT